jgi:hypothetical protein
MTNQQIIQHLEEIYNNCSNVIDEDDIHTDAKNIAKLIKIDCRRLIHKINKEFVWVKAQPQELSQ